MQHEVESGFLPQPRPARPRGPVERIAQRVEDAGRAALLGTAMRISRQERPVDPDLLSLGPHRVLFIREDAMGDMVLTLSAIRAIAEAHPGNTVDVVTSPYNRELLQGLPYVNDVVYFPRHDRRRVRAALAVWRRRPYDVVVDGMALRSHVRTRSIAIMLASRARYWIGEGGRRNAHLYNVVVPPFSEQAPHVDRMLQLAAPLLRRGQSVDARPSIVVDEAERGWAEGVWANAWTDRWRILVNVSASMRERQWPLDRWQTVIEHVARTHRGVEIVVVGLARDAELLAALEAHPAVTTIAPTVRQLIALTATCDLLVSPNTSAIHIASAFERAVVSLSLPKTEAWTAHDTPQRNLISTELCSIGGIGTAAVTAAVDELLAELAEVRRRRLTG